MGDRFMIWMAAIFLVIYSALFWYSQNDIQREYSIEDENQIEHVS